MTALYLLINLSPLFSLSSRSQPFLQALTRECSGDCRQCGCSTERSASHTCCCALKRAAETKKRQQCAVNTTPVAVTGEKSGGDCCNNYLQQYAAEKSVTVSDHITDNDPQTVSISTCPCGSGNDLTFSGFERTQHIPCLYLLSGIPIQPVTQFAFMQPEHLFSRSGEPPDPPPKLIIS